MTLRPGFLLRLSAAVSILTLPAISVAGGTAAASIDTTAGPLQLAQAIVADPSTLVDASFVAVPPQGTPNGVSTTPIAGFPTTGSQYAILSNGNASLAADAPGAYPDGFDDGGGNVRGNSDYDVTILKVDVNVPAGDNCLLGFDFKFLSEEYPTYVGTQYNDAFIAELDNSTWTTNGSQILAPNNFAFDPSHNPISVNSSGPTSMNAANSAGTPYGGATPTLTASTPVTPGPHSIYFSIFDQGDHILDSAVFLDNLSFGSVADPATQCVPGAHTESPPTLTLSQASGSISTFPILGASSTNWLPGEKVDLYLETEFGATLMASGTADAAGTVTFSNSNASVVILPQWLVTDSTDHLNDCQGAYALTGCGYVMAAMGVSGTTVGEASAGFMLDTNASGTGIAFPASPPAGDLSDPSCGMPGSTGGQVPAPALPLTVSGTPSQPGRWVVESNGVRFKFNSVNWYGAEEASFVPGGLDCQSLDSIASEIATLGFNSVRLPFSDAMVELNPSVCQAINPDPTSPWNHDGEECIPREALAANPQLMDKTALQIYQDTIDALAARHIAIILDNHSTDASFTPSPYEGLWWGGKIWDDRTNSKNPPWRFRTQLWEQDWVNLLRSLQSDPYYPYVVGADLRNEPGMAPAYNKLDPQWPAGGNPLPKTTRASCLTDPANSSHPQNDSTNWVEAAQAGGNTVLCADPNLLVIVEGTKFSGDLSGILQHENGNPVVTAVTLDTPLHVVYSVHDYPCSQNCSFQKYQDFAAQLGRDWGYLLNQGQPYTAPVWIGEFGATQSEVPQYSYPTQNTDCKNAGDGAWFNCFITYLASNDADWSYWAINGTEADAGIHDPTDPRGLTHDESYGLLTPAWNSIRSEQAYVDLHSLIGPATQGP